MSHNSNKICDFTDAELRVAAGTLMRDLRGDWGSEYVSRIEKLVELMKQIASNDTSQDQSERTKAVQVLHTCEHQMNNQEEYGRDGRYFRDLPFYDEYPEAGKTERVELYLYRVLNYPEYSWLGEKK